MERSVHAEEKTGEPAREEIREAFERRIVAVFKMLRRYNANARLADAWLWELQIDPERTCQEVAESLGQSFAEFKEEILCSVAKNLNIPEEFIHLPETNLEHFQDLQRRWSRRR